MHFHQSTIKLRKNCTKNYSRFVVPAVFVIDQVIEEFVTYRYSQLSVSRVIDYYKLDFECNTSTTMTTTSAELLHLYMCMCHDLPNPLHWKLKTVGKSGSDILHYRKH